MDESLHEVLHIGQSGDEPVDEEGVSLWWYEEAMVGLTRGQGRVFWEAGIDTHDFTHVEEDEQWPKV